MPFPSKPSSGTHVAGSILGACESCGTGRLFAGAAPGARVAFTDLGIGPLRTLISPVGGLVDYFNYSYALGARVHSDSWGTAVNAYTAAAQQVDEFLYHHDDFVSVFAAGNGGDSADMPYSDWTTDTSSIGAPATAKNAIAVGATRGPPSGLTADSTTPESESSGDGTPPALSFLFEVLSPSTLQGRRLRALQAPFGPSFLDRLSQIGLGPGLDGNLTWVTTEPADGCVTVDETLTLIPSSSAFTSASDISNNDRPPQALALIARGSCLFLDKALAAQQAGAVGVLIYNDEPAGAGFPEIAAPPDRAQDLARLTIPVGALPASTGLMLRDAAVPAAPIETAAAAGSGAAAGVLIRGLGVIASSTDPYDNIAAFSSFGPSFDGRIKPDLVAPGENIRSSYATPSPASGPICATALRTGTR